MLKFMSSALTYSIAQVHVKCLYLIDSIVDSV